MATAPYVYEGEPRDYHHLGNVRDGDVAWLSGPPDSRWRPWNAEVDVTDEATVDTGRAERHDAAMRQPNKAASADEWRSFAVADGGFEQATGTHPDEATRRSIVEHYNADTSDESADTQE